MVPQLKVCLGSSTSLPKAAKALRGSIGATAFLAFLLEILSVVQDLQSMNNGDDLVDLSVDLIDPVREFSLRSRNEGLWTAS